MVQEQAASSQVELEEFAATPEDAGVDELEALRAERDELRDKFMRALADAENSRKRAERDRKEAEMYGGTRLARDLLPVYDNLNRALQAIPEESRAASAALIEGVELTLKELTNVMARHGVKAISPAVGDTFDPQLHQAMFEAPVPGTKAGQIIQVATEGFMLHDRLLRPAQVGVSSNTEE
ncbi:nucleotide exchange factor GrpE [Tabrizicola caldifontis]|uniref:nucleotide exchange factor GrpE n=1 Tax=Tabrizicola caldifontis TaxID=2528036 RepID=UPI001081018F|nr:nucleotide exchange factor GrpE [Rhodobacter sp. YIM 73028]